MSFTSSSSNSLKKVFFWTFIGALILLLIAAAAGVLGAALGLLALLLFVVGLVAVIRGDFPMFGISTRRTAAGVLLLGAYFAVLGVVTSTNTDDDIPVVVAAGDTCEVTGKTSDEEEDTLYCVPSESGDLVWGTAADFDAYQEAEREKIENEAEQEAQATIAERDEEVAAAEKRAEEAREEEKAEEEAAAAEAEEERQRQEEAAQNTPAPVASPEPQNNTNSDTSAYYENCTAAREAGAAPVHRGEPGYGTHLDRDGDGIGCE